MIGKKVLIIAPYPIVSPRHGGQKRVRALVEHYRSIFQEVRFVGIFRMSNYESCAETDLTINDAQLLNELDANPYNAALLVGSAPSRDKHIKVKLKALFNSYRPDIIQIEQPFFYNA